MRRCTSPRVRAVKRAHQVARFARPRRAVQRLPVAARHREGAEELVAVHPQVALVARRAGVFRTATKDSASRVRRTGRATIVAIPMTRRPAPILALALLAGWLPVSRAQQPYDSFSQSTVDVPMRDGVKLSTDVYLPARAKPAAGRLPVLLVRTPYNKNGQRSNAASLARRGFVVVAQDVRGRFASQGDFYPFLNEGLDGYDAIEWAAAQPWSNGKVGMFGSSYLAWDQYHAAMLQAAPPGRAVRHRGRFQLLRRVRLSRRHPEPRLGAVDPLDRPSPASRRRQTRKPPRASPPSRRAPPDGSPCRPARAATSSATCRRTKRSTATSSATRSSIPTGSSAASGPPATTSEIKDIPMFFLTGWYDYFAEGVLENFAALCPHPEDAQEACWWAPGRTAPARPPAATSPSDRPPPSTRPASSRDWFDHCLRGARLPLEGACADLPHGRRRRRPGATANWPTAESGAPPIPGRLPAGRRRATTCAPAARSIRPHPAPKSLPPGSTTRPGPSPPSAAATIPARRTRCARPAGWAAPMPRGSTRAPTCCRSLPRRSPAGAEVTGRGKVSLWASAGAPSADFIVKLIDVYPDGYALILSEGQVRASASSGRGGWRSRSNPPATGSRPGHRIRLDIAGSNFPRNETNPAAGRQQVYHDRQRPSYLELPVR